MANKLFSEEEKKFIFQNCIGNSVKKLTNIFNKKFNRNITEKQIYVFKKHNHLKNEIYSIPKALFNNQEKKYILNNIKNKSTLDFVNEFNKKFNRKITYEQMNNYKRHHQIKSELGAGFYKGHIPTNRSKIGMEVTRWDGITYVKIENPSVYEQKHRYLYKKYKGEIPKNSVVIFADGDKTNFDLDNLLLITKGENYVMSTQKLMFNNAELTKTGQIIAKLKLKMKEVE